jgi:ferrochelatase
MLRVPTAGTHPAFVRGLVDLVEERTGGREPEARSRLGPWPGVCAAGCCTNARASLPAIAGAD